MASTSAEPGVGGVSARLAELEAVLAPLVPVLERLHAAQLEQRRVVVSGDLSAMVVVNTAIEETSARLALLEQRRQSIQAELEGELGVRGLRAALMAAAIPPAERARIGQLLVQVARLVREIREQGRRNADLLRAAIGAASHTRKMLERLGGVDTTYGPAPARQQQAALRARARLGAATPAASAAQRPDRDAAAPAADGGEAL